jgi:hypothetical protein
MTDNELEHLIFQIPDDETRLAVRLIFDRLRKLEERKEH